MSLTVSQGVALKPIQVLLVQHLGQVTAADEAGLIHSHEAADQGDEQWACHPWRGGGRRRVSSGGPAGPGVSQTVSWSSPGESGEGSQTSSLTHCSPPGFLFPLMYYSVNTFFFFFGLLFGFLFPNLKLTMLGHVK